MIWRKSTIIVTTGQFRQSTLFNPAMRSSQFRLLRLRQHYKLFF